MNQDCPLCLEPLAIDDVNFFPCECRYQICRFCWHRIRTDEDGRCPHCRLPYSENPAEYIPLTSEQLSSLKEKGRKKNHEKKQKLMESRKNLADVRVVQRNLVFVIGLSPRLADPEILKKHEYFGKYGRIFKVVINHHTVYSGQQGPSVSAYVTYVKTEDASKAIQAVNNAYIDGRYLKASYGTTKYCSFFLRGIQCTKPDCMYLHEMGESDASFTKEDMQLGKHQEYEQAALSNGGVLPIPLKDNSQNSLQQKSTTCTPDRKSNSKSKPRPQSVHESALPSSANWGSKVDEIDSIERSHSSSSRRRGSETSTRGLQRTNSYPVKSSREKNMDNNGGESRNDNDEEMEGKSPNSSNLNQSRLGTPCSLSSSVESLQSLSSSGGGASSVGVAYNNNNHSCSDLVKSSNNQKKSKENELLPEENQCNPMNNIPPPIPLPEPSSDNNEGDRVERDGIGEDTAEKDNWKERIYMDNEEQENDSEQEPTLDVFKTLGAAVPYDFGSLGVSWQTNDDKTTTQPRSELNQRPSTIEGPEFMPMAWDPLKNNRESTILATILSGSDSSPPKSREPVDEKQRLVSATYVNYGPTTNNGLNEYQAREISHGKPCNGTTDMLRSTLEDGFKILFPNIHSNPVHQGLQTSAHSSSSNRFPSTDLPKNTTSEWPDLKTEKTNKSSVAPPPGFGPPQRSKRIAHNDSVGTATTPTGNSYSLWGGGGGKSGNSNTGGSSSLQGLFQQQEQQRNSGLSSSVVNPKPLPVGAIPANVLEASLLASQAQQHQHQQLQHQQLQHQQLQHQQLQQQQLQQQQLQQLQQLSLMSKNYNAGGVAATPPNTAARLGNGGNNATQTAALMHQQQQMKQLQQQMYIQHQLRQQQLMKAGMSATPTSTVTHPPNGYSNQRPFTNPNYRSWTGPYVMGGATRPTLNNYGTVNNHQWTGQTGFKQVSDVMGATHQHNAVQAPPEQQGYQNVNLKH